MELHWKGSQSGSDLLTPLSFRFRTSAGRVGKWLCSGDWSYSLSKQIISSQLTYFTIGMSLESECLPRANESLGIFKQYKRNEGYGTYPPQVPESYVRG